MDMDDEFPVIFSDLKVHNYSKHKDEVNSVDFSPDMQILVTGCDDGRTRIFDNVKHHMILKFPRREGAIRTVAVSKNSRFIASGGYDKLICIYLLREAQLVHSLEGHKNSVEAVCFTNNCDRLCSGSWDRTIVIWNLETGGILQRYSFHESLVQCLAVSPDDSLLAAGSYDRTISLWSLSENDEDHTLYTRAEVLSRRYKSRATFRPHRDHRCVTLVGHTGNVHTLAFGHTSNRYLVSGGWDTRVLVWDLLELTLLRQLSGPEGWVQAVQWSPDDLRIVAASDQDSVRVWETHSGRCVAEYEMETQLTAMFVAMTTEGNVVLAGGDFVADFLTLPVEEGGD